MTSTVWGRCCQRLPLVASWAVLVGLAIAFTSAPAQTKKTDPPKKTDPKKEVDPPVKKGTIVKDEMVSTVGGLEQVALINKHIEEGWKGNKIQPSDRCTDYEFIRRASLDIIGRIAKVHEIDRFLKDPPNRRRSLLIERLMGNPNEKSTEAIYAEEFAQNWSNIWTVMLLTRSGSSKLAQEQMRDWLMSQFREEKVKVKDPDTNKEKEVKVYADWSRIVTELITATGTTNENGAVNFILHHLGDAINAKDAMKNGKYEMVPITSRTTRLFLGLRTQCVQCHNHPFNPEWEQHHFWGINAFFRQVDPSGRPGMMAKKKAKKGEGMLRYTLKDNPDLNVRGIVPYEPRSGLVLFTDAKFLDGAKMDVKDKETTRRKELAKFITKSPYFGKVMVNRTWGHFFGLSFTKIAPDDFGEHNECSHPDLLDRLSEDWAKKYNHDPKQLIRWICNSRAYGLSSVANKTNDKPDDERFFPRMLLKPMSPEQLFESLMVATDAKINQSRQDKEDKKREWLDKLIVNFGDDEGNEGSFNGTVVQALLLMNGQDINAAIMDKKDGTVAMVIQKHGNKGKAGLNFAMRDLYMAALNRPPSAKEYERVLNPKMWVLPKSGAVRNDFWEGFYQDMFWAALNSNEFILNH